MKKYSLPPADPILGLTEEFKKDARAEKINLGVGIYKNEDGQTPVLATVKKAEAALLENEKTKSYLTIEGTAEYGLAVQKLLFGADAEIVTSQRAKTAQAPGGTGALRVAGEFIKRQLGDVKIWISKPNVGQTTTAFSLLQVLRQLSTATTTQKQKTKTLLAWLLT